MKVSEIMTNNPVCCWPSSSTLSAALLMQETDTGIVPVIQDPFTPRLIGVVTDRDLCLYVVAAGRDPSSSWVDGCMRQDPVCCTEQDDVSLALDLMKDTSGPASAGGERKTRDRGHVVPWRSGAQGRHRSKRCCGGFAEHLRACSGYETRN